MSPFSEQSLICLAYCVTVVVLAVLLDGLPFIGALIVATLAFALESVSAIRRIAGRREDSAGSGAG